MKKQLTYGQAIELVKTETPIKDYVFQRYPMDTKMLGRYGHGMTKTSLDNTLKFAKKRDDKTLIKLLLIHFANIINIYKD